MPSQAPLSGGVRSAAGRSSVRGAVPGASPCAGCAPPGASPPPPPCALAPMMRALPPFGAAPPGGAPPAARRRSSEYMPRRRSRMAAKLGRASSSSAQQSAISASYAGGMFSRLNGGFCPLNTWYMICARACQLPRVTLLENP